MNRFSKDERAKIIAGLREGNSPRATARMCDVAFNTVPKLLPEIGAARSEYQDRVLRRLTRKRIQCDEIRSSVHGKANNVTPKMLERGLAGDVWTWTPMDAETKLVPHGASAHGTRTWRGSLLPIWRATQSIAFSS